MRLGEEETFLFFFRELISRRAFERAVSLQGSARNFRLVYHQGATWEEEICPHSKRRNK